MSDLSKESTQTSLSHMEKQRKTELLDGLIEAIDHSVHKKVENWYDQDVFEILKNNDNYSPNDSWEFFGYRNS